MTDEDVRTYEVVATHGRFRLSVPASWKVTYGPILGTKGAMHGMTLRFYENETRQRALFTDVLSFRDTSISMLRYAKRRPGSAEWFDPDNPLTPDLGRNVEYGWAPEDQIIGLDGPRPIEENDAVDYPTAKYAPTGATTRRPY